jgi:hypothetical protein
LHLWGRKGNEPAVPARAAGPKTKARSPESRAQSPKTNRTGILQGVDAAPLLAEIGRHLNDIKLEAVLIGNAAAALQGAPVTTVDFDLLFRATPRNLAKLKTLSQRLNATILRPYYPASDLYRVVRDDDGLQVDFMGTIHGLRSFAGVRDRASVVVVAGVDVLVASLADIIKSKKAARRPRDLAVLEVLEKAREEMELEKDAPGRRRQRK